MTNQQLPTRNDRASRRARAAMERRGETMWFAPMPENTVERYRLLNRVGRLSSITTATPEVPKGAPK